MKRDYLDKWWVEKQVLANSPFFSYEYVYCVANASRDTGKFPKSRVGQIWCRHHPVEDRNICALTHEGTSLLLMSKNNIFRTPMRKCAGPPAPVFLLQNRNTQWITTTITTTYSSNERSTRNLLPVVNSLNIRLASCIASYWWSREVTKKLEYDAIPTSVTFKNYTDRDVVNRSIFSYLTAPIIWIYWTMDAARHTELSHTILVPHGKSMVY
jgi:hypothetical protein